MPVVVHPDGPTGPYGPVPKFQCVSRRVNASLRRAFSQNVQDLCDRFDYGDLGGYEEACKIRREQDIEARDQDAELLRKQTAEAQQRAYLAALKADAAYQNSETMYGAIASTSNSRPELPRFIINPHNNDTRSVDELARDRELAGEDNDVGDNEEADSQQSSGDYSEDEEGDNEEVQDESEESD
ncbi:hypothetical protein Tco_0679249 [Tanacetum coccineum]|uniref:Uncharacterized protein n=1 Tax=Tanacetum coccineum TaxID=301880 RepID=A0ABQ4XI29_9ASTR